MKTDTQFEGLEVGFDVPALPGMDAATSRRPAWCWTSTRWSAISARWVTGPAPTACATGCMARCTSRWTWRNCRNASAGPAASAARRSARPRSSRAAASRMCWFPTRCAMRPRSTGWRGCRNLGARTIVCVDDIDNVADLSEAAARHGTRSSASWKSTAAPGAAGSRRRRTWWPSPRPSRRRRGSSSRAFRPTRARCSTLTGTRTARKRSTSPWPWCATRSRR